MSIHTKLQAIQAELKAPKSQYNSFGKYKYRSCEDILEAVKPLLQQQGCVLTISDEVQQVGERYYIVARATITDGQESVSVTAAAREEESKKGMDASQISGTASSYARKYALNGLFCIDDTKDADAINTHGKKEEYTGSDADPLGSRPLCAYCAQPLTGAEYKGQSYSCLLYTSLLIRGSGVRIPSGVPRDYQLKTKILGLMLVIFCLYDFERHQKGTKTGKNFCSSAETL